MNTAVALVRAGLERVKSWFDGEGSWRGPFFGQGHLGNWFRLGRLEDGFQRDLRVASWDMQRIPVIAGLRQLHRSAFAQLRPHHMRQEASGAITDLENSAPLRALLRPNSYESGADLASRIADTWMTIGEVAVWGIRNDRNEIDQLHLLPHGCWRLMIDEETKTVFYGVNPSGALLRAVDAQIMVPARDVMHLRWATPRHPLMGESGFAAAGLSAGIHVALSESQAAFFSQMRRPSGIISTDEKLNAVQMTQLRAAFDEQAAKWAQGGVPILGWGAKWLPTAISSEDAEVIAALRMTNEEIARCVGVPGPLVGDLEKAGLANTEALIAHWLSISLGGLIERYEAAWDRLFDLNGRTEWIDMSTEALLRVDIQRRMDALTKGVQGGVYTPNDARKREGLSPIAGGDQAFLQRQMTPVNLLDDIARVDLTRSITPAPVADVDEDDEEDDEEAQAMGLHLQIQREIRAAKAAHRP